MIFKWGAKCTLMCFPYFYMIRCLFIFFVTNQSKLFIFSFGSTLLLHGGAGRMSYCELIVCDVVALLTENGAMHLNPTWFHLFPLHLARGPWRAVQQFISTQTKKPLRLPSPQSDAHIIRYPQAGSDLIKHPVWVSCQLLTVASLGAIPTMILNGS